METQRVFEDFYESWHWLKKHPQFFQKGGWAGWPGFKQSLEIDVVRVNPEDDSIDDDKSKNTETRIWLECGGWMLEENEYIDEKDREKINRNGGQACHDIDLDCGAPTYEEAIVELANLTYKKYGDYDQESPEHKVGSKEWKAKYNK